jgi:hypothetical protein
LGWHLHLQHGSTISIQEQTEQPVKTIYFYPELNVVRFLESNPSAKVIKLPEIALDFVYETIDRSVENENRDFHYDRRQMQTIRLMAEKHERGFFDNWNWQPNQATEELVRETSALMSKQGGRALLAAFLEVSYRRAAQADSDSKSRLAIEFVTALEGAVRMIAEFDAASIATSRNKELQEHGQ